MVLNEYNTVIDQLETSIQQNAPRFLNRFKAINHTLQTKVFKQIESYCEKQKCVKPHFQVTNWLEDNNLIIKPADKNLGPTIMHVEQFLEQVTLHLNDSKSYKPLGSYGPCFKSIKIKVWEITDKYRDSLTKSDYTRLRSVPHEAKIMVPEFYIMPKLHKAKICSRPIIPSINWITTNASKWLSEKLQPMKAHFPWIAKNSIQVINHLQDNVDRYTPGLLVTADATSLYTNIDLTEGVRKVKWLLLTTKLVDKATADLIEDLLNFVMHHNYFKFNDNWYKQIRGTAMGSNVAPDFADLFVASLEYKLKNKPNARWPKTYFRYIDDVFYIWDFDTNLSPQENRKLHKDFKDSLLNVSPSLKLNFEENPTTANFLDLQIYHVPNGTGNGLYCKNYIKSTNLHLYTSPHTYNPFSVKYNWIQGETIRLIRNSSTKKSFSRSMKNFQKHLLSRGYDRELVQSQFNKVTFCKRPELLKTAEKVVLETKGRYIVLNNIPGRHIIQTYVRKLLSLLSFTIPKPDPNKDKPEEYDAQAEFMLSIKLCVKRGRRIIDILNSSNKRILKALGTTIPSLTGGEPKRLLSETSSEPHTEYNYKKSSRRYSSERLAFKYKEDMGESI